MEWFAHLNQSDFITVMWLLPIANAIHVGEELTGLSQWYQKTYAEVPNSADVSVPSFLLTGTVFAFVVFGILAWIDRGSVAAWIALLLAAPLLWNALQHVFHALYFEQYIPAVITASSIVIPTVVYVAFRAVQDSLVPNWYVAALAIGVVIGLLPVLKAGEKLTAEFLIFHNIGLSIRGCLRNRKRSKSG